MTEAIIRVLQGRATPEEAAEVERWRSAAPENHELFQEIAGVWELTAESDAPVGVAAPPSASDLIRGGDATRGGGAARSISSAGTGAARRTNWWVLGLAASLLLVMVAGILRLSTPDFLQPEVRHVAGPDAPMTVALKDGSVVRLAPGAVLSVSGTAQDTQVELTGLAFFSVPPRDAGVFTVETDGLRVGVTGTRFEVRSSGHGGSVRVLDGRVTVRTARDSVQMAAGRSAEVSPGGSIELSADPDPFGSLEWMGAFVAFEGTKLADVASELRTRFGVVVVEIDPDLRDRTVTAVFEDATLGEILDVVCRAAGIRCEPDEAGVSFVR